MLTRNNNNDKEEICKQGIIHLFDVQLTAREKFCSAPHNAASTVLSEIVNSSRICSGPPQPLNTHTTDPNSATTQIPHIDPSAQQNGNALPPSRHWPGLRTQPLAMTYPNSPNAQESSGLMSPPPGLIALQQQLNETDIKVFLYATIMLCDKLPQLLTLVMFNN